MYILSHTIYIVNPITGRGGQADPPLHFFNIAQKPLVLLTYNFFTFPKYEFNMFIKKFSLIYFFWAYFSCTFLNPRPNVPSSSLLNPLRSFEQILGPFLEKHSRYEGGGESTPPLPILKTVLRIRSTQNSQYSKTAVSKTAVLKNRSLKNRSTQKPQYSKSAVLKIRSLKNRSTQYSTPQKYDNCLKNSTPRGIFKARKT